MAATEHHTPATPAIPAVPSEQDQPPLPSSLVPLLVPPVRRWQCCHCGGTGLDSYGDTCPHCHGHGHC